MVLEFWGKPLVALNEKLSKLRTSGGKPVRLLMLFNNTAPMSGDLSRPALFKEVAEKFKIPYFDLNPYLNSLFFSFYPYSGTGHLDPYGAIFFGKLLARVLPNEGLIPWPTPAKTPTP
jgi:hypothetical protein